MRPRRTGARRARPPLGRLLVDVEPLRASREYRLLWSGQVVSNIGTQLTAVAVPLQAYDLTGSSLVVGLLGLAQLGPLLLLSLLGGAVADAFDRRRVLLVTQVLLAVTSVGLALNAVHGHSKLWLLFVLSALAAGVSGIDMPTRSAVVPGLVSVRQLPAALALQQIMWQVALVAGPALAGLIIAKLSMAAAYWADVGTFAVATVAVLAMRPLRPAEDHARVGLRSVVEGFRFLRGRRALQGTFVIDVNAMVFGMPRAVFPELAARVFGGGATTVGYLYAAPGVGALVGAISSGWVGRVRRQGLAVLIAVGVWGACIAAFGVMPMLWGALVLLAVAGAADVVSAVFRNSILQISVPDRLRGRLSAVHIAVVTGGPRLGDAESGAVASALGPRASVVTGGLACMAGVAVIARLIPELARWLPDEVPEDQGFGPPAG